MEGPGLPWGDDGKIGGGHMARTGWGVGVRAVEHPIYSRNPTRHEKKGGEENEILFTSLRVPHILSLLGSFREANAHEMAARCSQTPQSSVYYSYYRHILSPLPHNRRHIRACRAQLYAQLCKVCCSWVHGFRIMRGEVEQRESVKQKETDIKNVTGRKERSE